MRLRRSAKGGAMRAADYGNALGGLYGHDPWAMTNRLAQLFVARADFSRDQITEAYIPPRRPDGHAGILLAAGLDPDTERFTLAHALGHHVLKHADGIYWRYWSPVMYDKQEHQADVFAAHFLWGEALGEAALQGETARVLDVHHIGDTRLDR